MLAVKVAPEFIVISKQLADAVMLGWFDGADGITTFVVFPGTALVDQFVFVPHAVLVVPVHVAVVPAIVILPVTDEPK